MLKKYKSKSCVSISVVLPTGGNTHVSFNPVTGGGSVYYTDNVHIQQGLERHPKYGKLFVADDTLRTQGALADRPQGTGISSRGKREAPTGGDIGNGGGVKAAVEVKMTCNDDAKDYLADKFGISRSKMRSRSEIEKVASENGVVIIWS